MNVLLVSQCRKLALNETRRILDQFAERHGNRSWQTAITWEGLKTVHKLLRCSARKNTSVACFRLRRNGSELLWIVGDVSHFNERGVTPTNTTQRDLLRQYDEDDWRTGEDARLLSSLAGLFHDLGKANLAFQDKLRATKPVADVHRHEWVSLRLFQAFVGSSRYDADWLKRLAEAQDGITPGLLGNLHRDGIEQGAHPPFKSLPPLAQAVGWLIISHHRLPANPEWKAGTRDKLLKRLPDSLTASWCGERPQRQGEMNQVYQKLKEQCWQFPKGTPFNSRHWRKHASRLARQSLDRKTLLQNNWLDNPYALHLTRLGLMLADHYYSSQDSHARYGDPGYPLHANTDKQGQLKQRLDEHLIGVEVNASRLLRQLPRLHRQVSRIARHKGFRQRSKDRRFAWQDKSFDLAAGIRERATRQGFFGVNMASTGTGKTLANGRILYAMADPRLGARFNIALGLRTLTLQTGDAYRERLKLGAEDMAVLVGGGAIRELHEQQQADNRNTGSESTEDFMDAASFVHYEGSLEDGPLSKWLKNNGPAQKLLDAPVLICTIDHLMPAVESTRGGHQIAPMLRLLTSDLVLDEPDDFDLNDLPALTRLVHWAGLLGTRVLLSSATLPPALVEGLYRAYRAGREVWQQNRGKPGQLVNICCAWFDEFGATAQDCANSNAYLAGHQKFVDKRLKKLAAQEQRRKADILTVGIASKAPAEELYPALACLLRDTAQSLHQHHHSTDPKTGKRLSCGLIRISHIDDIIPTAGALLKLGAVQDKRIHLCIYHSRHPLLMRSRLEEKLDRLLKRQQEAAIFHQPEIRAMLDEQPESDHLFIVLASPVAEVGRDHDYDWAIVEPSSMRSIIQLAGRVRRHRAGEVEQPNIALLQTNLAHIKNGGIRPAYCHPGFETTAFQSKQPLLQSHDLNKLITVEQLQRIDATSRIREREALDPRNNLADLEHAQLRVLLLNERIKYLPGRTSVTHWYQTRAHLSGELQRIQPFRYDQIGTRRYFLSVDENDELAFYRFEKRGADTEHSQRLTSVELETGENISLFADIDYPEALDALAENMHMENYECARRLGLIELPEGKDQQPEWYYHPALGFTKKPPHGLTQ